jgi:hypothetical protein
VNPKIWRRIVIASYLAASLAAATLAPGFKHDLVWIPELAWAANIVIVLAAIALARTHAPLRLQLALAFAAPGLHVVLLLGRAAYSGGSPFNESIMILGLMFGWIFYSEFLGSVLAFAIALAFQRTSTQTGAVTQHPVRPGVFSRMFRALGWVSAAAWLYMLVLGMASAYVARPQPHVEALLTQIYGAAAMVGWIVSPLWIVGAIALLLSSGIRKQRPAIADMAVLLLVLGLIGVYCFLASQD